MSIIINRVHKSKVGAAIWGPCPKVIKLFSCSTHLSMKFTMKFIKLINVKMSTIVGILIFISMINTLSKISNWSADIFVLVLKVRFVYTKSMLL